MGDAERKPPAFFCPACGQKHRADLEPLRQRAGASLGTKCRRCGVALQVRLEDGKPVCEIAPASEAPAEAEPTPPPKAPEEAPPPAAAETTKARRAARRASRGNKAKAQAEETPAAPPVSVPALPTAPKHRPYDAALSDKPLEVGQRVNRYTIRAVLRQGLTGTVYKAHDPTTKRAVALKILGTDAPTDVRERFIRQMDVQAGIRHPNVLPVYDRGALEDGRPYMVMELLHHPVTLGDILDRRAEGKLAVQKTLAPLADLETLVERVLIPVADGIYVANNESGVVHGDLRPENVLIDGHTLRPYVVDFGRASAWKEGEERNPAVMPATHYLSPEQAHGNVHGRTDVWGLGALLHAMITGKPPLTGSGDALRTEAAHAQYAPLPESAPPVLKAIVQKAMAKRPEARYVNARQLAADLKAWRHGSRVRAVDEFGGPGATEQVKRQALLQNLRVAGWVAAGLVVGLLVGSRIRIGGEDPDEVRMEGARYRVERLERDVQELEEQLLFPSFVDALSPAEAYGIWEGIDARARVVRALLAQVPFSSKRQALQARVEYVRGRVTPGPVVLDVPGLLPLTAVSTATDDRLPLQPGRVTLPPGRWEVQVGDGGRIRLPTLVPLTVRPVGREAEPLDPVARWSVPAAAAAVPSERTYVAGQAVSLHVLPYALPTAPVQVPGFAIDRRPVTNASYASFLASLPEDERDERAPPVGMEKSLARMWRPVTGAGTRPVVGVRPEDARAYCAWASAEGSVSLRLPTEAEWLLASGWLDGDWGRGDLVAPGSGSPYGMEAMPDGLGEMVADGDTSSGARVKGRAADGTTPFDAGTLDDGVRAEDVGFRCVQVLPEAAVGPPGEDDGDG